MKVSDIFILHQGNGFELYNMLETKDSNINFVSRTAQNNGVVAQVLRDENIAPFPAGFLTVALGGSVLSSFVQVKPFYTSFHIMVLEPKSELSFNEKLYYCMCIQRNAYRYSYGRQANKSLKDLELPDNIPDWVNSTKVIPHSTNNSTQNVCSTDTWKEFSLGSLFVFVKGKRLTKADMLPGNINFIGATSDNNGVREHIDTTEINPPNCITVSYNGSVGEAFYQEKPFWASDDVNILYPKNWEINKYIALFIITVIKANRFKFSYGRKWTLDKMKQSIIKLPTTDSGTPNFQYMERYIKSLPFCDRI